MPAQRPDILVATPLTDGELASFSGCFAVTYSPGADGVCPALSEGGRFRAIVTRSKTVIGEAELDRLPELEIVVALGSGTDGIDRAALSRRSIRLATGRGVNAASVADHAFAFILSLLRDVTGLNALVRKEGPLAACAPPRSVTGARLGIVGLGAVGSEIARRAGAFGMPIAYHGRSARRDVEWPFHGDVRVLTAESDILVLCCPGGAETHHLVDAETLRVLGPDGFLVNVARGSVVDTAALAAALENGSIAGAALDVIEATPDLFARLKACRNVLFSPHTAGRSPESLAAALALALKHLRSHFFGGGEGI